MTPTRIQLAEADRKRLESLAKAAVKEKFTTKGGLANEAMIGYSTLRELLNQGSGSDKTLKTVLQAIDLAESDPLYEYTKGLSPDVQKMDAADNAVRHRTLVLVAVLLVTVGVMSILVLLRTLNTEVFSSQQEVAAQKLDQMGVALTVESVASSIAAVDVDTLNLISTAGASTRLIEAALSKGGREFAKNSIGDVAAADWLNREMERGVNPDLRVLSAEEQEVSFLHVALESGNADLAISLIDHNATPYPYQNLYYAKDEFPIFLHPIHGVARISSLRTSDKEKIARRLLKAGVGYYKPVASEKISIFQDSIEERQQDFDELIARLDQDISIDFQQLRTETKLDFSFSRRSEICLSAENRFGGEWCSAMEKVPAIISSEEYRDHYLGVIFVLDLMAISEGRMYFQVIQWLGDYQFGMLEVAADEETFIFWKWDWGSAPLGVKGRCIIEKYQECFRSLVIDKHSETEGKTSYGTEVLFTSRGTTEEEIVLPTDYR